MKERTHMLILYKYVLESVTQPFLNITQWIFIDETKFFCNAFLKHRPIKLYECSSSMHFKM